ncbi:MAG: type and secretion system protein [Rariglobus sp.]|jgi:general secretion pathway protein D|nr:type and secretion system protein [Rariglobus sp.]
MRLSRPFLLAGLCLIPVALCAQIPETIPTTTVPAATAPEEMIGPMRLPDTPLELVLQNLETWTGRIILRPQSLPQTSVTLNIPRPVPKSEALQALISVLALNNIGVVEMGDKYLKVVALANQTRAEAPELVTGSLLGLPPTGKVASKVFELVNLKAQDFVPQVNTLLNIQLGGAILFNNTNAFLVTDSIFNLQRVEQLIEALDRPASTDFTPKFYSLRFAKASDLVSRVKLMLQSPNQLALGNSLSLSADDRTNQVVLIADPKQQPFFDELIDKLDVKADPNTRNEVIYLKHATAKDVATLLTTVITGQTTAAAKSNGATRPQTGFGNTSPFNPTPAPAANNAPAAAANNTARPAAANTAASGLADSATQFSSLLTVASDDRSNAVVVSGTVDDIRLIRELVDKIDVVLAQVRIEVVIAEVTLTDETKTGLQALNLTVGPDSSGTTQITKFGGAVAGWTVSNGTVSPIAFDNLMTSTGGKSNFKVLSSPTIVTTHNNEAQIIVGESRPIITGSTSTPNTSGSGLTTSSSVTYKDIAIDLKVTPLIGDDGNIQLKIDQQVNDLLEEVVDVDNNKQPVIGRRQATSFINVLDGEMIVLGGLQRTKNTRSRTKLGFLVEIPILSHLLGARTKKEERTELLLFIRPHVLSPSIGTAQTRTEINRISNHDQVNTHITNTPFNPPPPLPTLPSKPAPAPTPPEKSGAKKP